MKKLFCLALVLLSIPVFAQKEETVVVKKKENVIQKTLNRFKDPNQESTVFIPKGSYSIGIKGGFRSFVVGGEADNDGYAILSLLNIGNGKLYAYSVSPSAAYFIAPDLSLGLRADYSGYQVDTDLKLDLRDIVSNFTENQNAVDQSNITVLSRHMVSNSWGGSLFLRKYLSFFGSQRLAVFGEARLYGKFSRVHSCPIVDYQVDEKGKAVKDENDNKINVDPHPNTGKERVSDHWGVGINLAAGACYRLKDKSCLFVSIPIVSAGYNYTKQFKTNTGNTAKVSQFNISRSIDFLAIQVGYSRFIEPKKKK